MLRWTFQCDGEGCDHADTVPPHDGAPPGWLVRTIIDKLVSLDEGATGTGFPSGRSELQRVRHYCPECRRKVPRQ